MVRGLPFLASNHINTTKESSGHQKVVEELEALLGL